jgi:PAS domain S-box-containing protein
LLRRVVESVSDYAIFSLDTRGRIASWNAGAARLFGIEQRDALGRDCSLLFPVEGRNSEPHWKLARDAGRAEVDTWFLGRDGLPFFGRGTVTAMRGKNGEIVGYSKVVQDVTARRLAEDSLRQKADQLAEANRLKDEFLAVLSHELRTPLNAIIGWTQLLMRPDIEPAVARQALETIARNGQVQLSLINDILDVSRTITGKMRLVLAPVDLETVVRAAVETVTVAADAKGITLTTVFDHQEPLMVNGDASRLQQVIWNLVSNAVKFTGEGGHVRVTVRRVGRSVEVEVADDGAGIATAFLPFVFDRFRQADSSTVRAHGGLGLGLAIVKHLTEAHGGSVAAHSEGEGRGATFRLRLPVLADTLQRPADRAAALAASEPLSVPDTAPAPVAQSTPVRLAGLRCLVVDDDQDARQLMRTVLEQAGARVTDAASVREALGMIGKAELVVADIGMPGQDGYAFIREVRALPPERGGRVPSIALTAYASEKDRQAALDAGFDEHLAKPLQAAGFFRTVVALLRGEAASGAGL